MLGICRDLDNAIARRDGEFIPRGGFMEIRERSGPGSVPRARWRGGRRRKDSAKPTVYLITATVHIANDFRASAS